MSNRLYNSIMPKNDNGSENRILNALNDYKNGFVGNPQQRVQELMQSGQMSESWYRQVQPMASLLYRLMKR